MTSSHPGTPVEEPWELEHAWQGRLQTRMRPGPPDAKGQQWAHREFTGLAHVICNCGFSSGWVPAPEAEPGSSNLRALLPDVCRAAADEQQREFMSARAEEPKAAC